MLTIGKNTIHLIALTGGPSGGKSSAMPYLREMLEEANFAVITVGETASELYNEGIEYDKLPVIPYQEVLLDRDVLKEDTAIKMAKIMAEKKNVVVFYDRGIMDGKAYMKDEDFEEMIASRSLSEESILKRYDAVFHLVTAAYGAEQYIINNNKARTEDIPGMRYLDDRVREVCWKNHPKRYFFDNSTGFEKKLERVWDCLKEYLEIN